MARMRLDIDQDEMGRRLGVSREWVSKLETGREAPSELMQYKLREIEATLGIHIKEPSFTSAEDIDRATNLDMSADVTVTGSPTADRLRAKIRTHVDQLLALAGDDEQRLGWLAEQLLREVNARADWDIHAHVIKKVMAERREREAAADPNQSSKKTRGAVG